MERGGQLGETSCSSAGAGAHPEGALLLLQEPCSNMLRSRSRSINFTEAGGLVRERCLAKKVSWRTNLLCGMYSQELTSSIFYTMEDEEVYLRQSPSKREEGEDPSRRASEQNPTATVRHVRMVGKSRRWSMANRTVSSFQRRLQRRVSRKVSGSMDNLHHPHHETNIKEAMELEAAKRVRGEGDRVVCEAVAVKDCHPSPYDRQALAFRRGDRIEVMRMGPTGIWRGRCRGREGNFKFIDVRTEKHPDKPRTVEASPSRRISRSQSVTDLLSSMSLENLTSVFVLNGYDTAEDIEQLCEEDLEYLGITEEETRELLLDTARHLARRDSAIDLDSPSSSTLESPSSSSNNDSTSSSSSSILDSASSSVDLASSFVHSTSSSVDSSTSVRSSFLHNSCYSYRDSGICVADV